MSTYRMNGRIDDGINCVCVKCCRIQSKPASSVHRLFYACISTWVNLVIIIWVDMSECPCRVQVTFLYRLSFRPCSSDANCQTVKIIKSLAHTSTTTQSWCFCHWPHRDFGRFNFNFAPYLPHNSPVSYDTPIHSGAVTKYTLGVIEHTTVSCFPHHSIWPTLNTLDPQAFATSWPCPLSCASRPSSRTCRDLRGWITCTLGRHVTLGSITLRCWSYDLCPAKSSRFKSGRPIHAQLALPGRWSSLP